MVYICDDNVDTIFSLDEYLDFVEKEVDLGDSDSMAETAWSLRALANNRSFLLDIYNQELIDLLQSKSDNVVTPQSLTVARKTNFFVRANIWLPESEDSVHRTSERKMYSYDLPHDHNFDFLTVGYFGPGYTTDLYSYDFEKVTGYIGEHVELQSGGTEQLMPGRVMLYRANEDVHIQYEPEEVSLSLNLMPLHQKSIMSPQFVFDIANSCLTSGVSDQVGSRIFLLDFFRHMSDELSVEILDSIAQNHACARTAGQALNVLTEIKPDEAERLVSRVRKEVLQFNRADLVHSGWARQKDSD
jgi:hypothetical protein